MMRLALLALPMLAVPVLAVTPVQAQFAEVSTLFKKVEANTQASVHVVRLYDGKTLFALNEDTLVSPASVTKLLTGAAVLSKFGPSHSFTTRVMHTGTRAAGMIKGDLVIVGDGDPFIVSEKLWQMAADLRHLGVKEVSGDLVIDVSLFDGVTVRTEGVNRSNRAYDAPVSAFGVNFNTLAVAIAPGEKVGAPARVSIDPYPLRGLSIEGRITTGTARSASSGDVSRIGSDYASIGMRAKGNVPEGAALRKIWRSGTDPVILAGEYVRAFLKNEGITVRGKVREGVRPKDAKTLLTIQGDKLRQIIQGLNTFSNNYIADVLVKRLGAAFPRSGAADGPGQGTFANGLDVMRGFLRQEVGIKTPFVLENGSGLTPENRITARQVTQLLAYMEGRMDLYPDFLASLPASGLDGTLENRFATVSTSKLKGQVRAKTGTLTQPVSVSSVAGYFRHPQHGLVAFAILENGRPGKAQPDVVGLRSHQDMVLAALFSGL